MIPWIQVYSNILTHDKTYKLAEALNVPNYSAVGLMVSLWCWVAINAPDGDITKYPPRAITEATGWPKKADVFYSALIDAGLIEKTEDGRSVIRNWEQYAMLLMDLMDSQKRKTAERVKKHRARKKQKEQGLGDAVPPDETPPSAPESDGEKRDCNVTETPSNALHNITLHNPTIPNPSPYGEDNNYFVVDGEGADAAQKAVGDYFQMNGLNFESYFGQTEQTLQTVREITDRIFQKFASRKPTEMDVIKVFFCTKVQTQTSDGNWELSFGENEIQLLMYAFEQAAAAGCPANWNYITGCLTKMQQRGITTLDQAADYDVQRDGV